MKCKKHGCEMINMGGGWQTDTDDSLICPQCEAEKIELQRALKEAGDPAPVVSSRRRPGWGN